MMNQPVMRIITSERKEALGIKKDILYNIIKFLKYNQGTAITLSFRPWYSQYIMPVLEDLKSIGTGIISVGEIEDSTREIISEKCGAEMKIKDKQITIRISSRLEQ